MRLSCKIILAFVILLTLLITLITLFFYAFNLTVASVCNISDQFHQTADFSPYFNTDDSQLVVLANKCLGSNANGDLFAVINISSFSGIQGLLEGIQNYKIKMTDIDTMSTNSTTLIPVQTSVSKVLDGSEASHTTVASQLSALNSIVACASITFALVSQSTSTVKSVTDKSVLTSG